MVLATPDRNPLRDSHRALRDRRFLRRCARLDIKGGLDAGVVVGWGSAPLLGLS